MEGGEPVEIELTPTAPRAAAAAGAPPPTEPGRHVGRPPGERNDGADRSLLVLAGVAVVAFAAGWFLGRSGGADDAERLPDAAARTTDAGAAAVEPAPDLRSPATEPARPSTTGAAPMAATMVDVDPRLASADYDIVGITGTGDLLELDLTDGALATREDVGTSGMNGPSALWAGDGWVVVPDWNTESSLLIEDDEDPRRIPIGPPWQVFPSETTGEFWVLDQNLRRGAPGTVQRVDRHAEPIGDPVSLVDVPQYSDPSGGLVVQLPDAAYRVDGDRTTKIVDGHLLALDELRAVTRTCDVDRRCTFVAVDRTTGAATEVPVESNTRYLPNYWSGRDGTRIAPDGRTIAVAWSEPRSGGSLGLIDVETGQLTTLSELNDGLIRWTPDGRFALFLESGVAMAHEIATGESFLVADDLPELNALTVRSSS